MADARQPDERWRASQRMIAGKHGITRFDAYAATIRHQAFLAARLLITRISQRDKQSTNAR